MWSWLRGKWTLPTFATVGALAIVIIGSKVFLEPQRTMEAGRDYVNAPPTAPSAPATEKNRVSDNPLAAPPAAEPPASEPASPFASGPARRIGPNLGGGRPGLLGSGTLAQRLSHHASHGRPVQGTGAAAPSAGRGSGPADELGGISSGAARGVGAAPPAALPPKASHDDLLEGTLPRGAADKKAEGRRDEYASPPAGWKGGGAPTSRSAPAPTAPPPAPVVTAAPPAAPAAAPRAAKKEVFDNALKEERSVERLRVEEPRPELAKKKAPPAAAESDEGAVASAAPREQAPVAANAAAPERAPAKPSYLKSEKAPAAKDADKERKQVEPTSEAALARRADQLFEAREWSAAIAAYRELLRRYPDADLAPRWRARVSQGQAAVAAANAETTSKSAAKAAPPKVEGKPAKSKPSDNALDGL
jgi:hypothetical protein